MSNDPGQVIKIKKPDGSFFTAQADSSGNLYVSLNTLLAGEDITNDVIKTETRCSYSVTTGLAATAVKSGAGFFHALQINTEGEDWEIDVYDGTSSAGTRIAKIRRSSMCCGIYDVAFTTGLFVDAVKGTGGGDLTVSYR